MVDYIGATIGDSLYLAGLYGAVSLASRHVPLSPKATVLLSLALTTLGCLGHVLKNKNCSWDSVADRRAEKAISIIPHLTLAAAVALKFLSPVGALAAYGAISLYCIISRGLIGMKSLEFEIFQEGVNRPGPGLNLL